MVRIVSLASYIHGDPSSHPDRTGRYCHSTSLEDHLAATVFDPLRASREERLSFAFPPAATNARYLCCDTKSDVGFAATSSGLGEMSVSTLSDIGLPECVVLSSKKDPQAAYLTPCSSIGGEVGAGWSSEYIVVDTACGEAVLRGSDVFSPGIIASSSCYEPGDRVWIVVTPCGLKPPLKGAMLPTLASVESSTDQRHDEPSRGDCDLFFVCLGKGLVSMSRKDVIHPNRRGVAVVNTWNPRRHPSSAQLDALFGNTEGRTRYFLQNWSSLIPGSLLMSSLAASVVEGTAVHVLDCCAAPGGKSSHLLQLGLKYFSSHSASPSPTPRFRLTACERSGARHIQLEQTLAAHFGKDHISAVCNCVKCDVNQLLNVVGTRTQYDGVLLDPPCTGLGLRPKLLPHPHSLIAVVQSADYQRKLFDSAWQLLKRGGYLSYSTCTISIEENEGNVLHFLRSYPDAQLCRATTTAHRNLLSTMKRWNSNDNPLFEAINSAASAKISAVSPQNGETALPLVFDDFLVIRCMPLVCDEEVTLDSVGFFAALFYKV